MWRTATHFEHSPIRAEKFEVVFWNVQGLGNKTGDIEKYLSAMDVIALSETWTEAKHFDAVEARLPQGFAWNWISATREKTRGRPAGGLLLGVRSSLQAANFTGNE